MRSVRRSRSNLMMSSASSAMAELHHGSRRFGASGYLATRSIRTATILGQMPASTSAPLDRLKSAFGVLTGAGIKFQKSKNIGSSRSATQNDVYHSIAGVERVVVVDIRDFPSLTFIPLDSKWLLRQAHTGVLTATGLSATKFYGLLAAEFSMEEKSFDLSLALVETGPPLLS